MAAGAPRHAHTARAPASGAYRTLCGAHCGRGLPGRGVPGRGSQGVACLALTHGVCSTVSKGVVWRAAGSRSAAASSSTSTASRCSACPLSSCPRRGAAPGLGPGLGLRDRRLKYGGLGGLGEPNRSRDRDRDREPNPNPSPNPSPDPSPDPSPNPSPNPHLTKGGAEELGAATGLGAKNNVKRAEQGKKVSQPVSLYTLTPLTGHGGYL